MVRQLQERLILLKYLDIQNRIPSTQPASSPAEVLVLSFLLVKEQLIEIS